MQSVQGTPTLPRPSRQRNAFTTGEATQERPSAADALNFSLPAPPRQPQPVVLPIQPSNQVLPPHPTELARDVLVRAVEDPAGVTVDALANALVTLLKTPTPAARKVDQLLVGFLRICIESNRPSPLHLYVAAVSSTLCGEANSQRRVALLAGLAKPVAPRAWRPFDAPVPPSAYSGPPLLGRFGGVGANWEEPLTQEGDDRAGGINAFLSAVLASPQLTDAEMTSIVISDFSSVGVVSEARAGDLKRHTSSTTTWVRRAVDQGHVVLPVCVLHAVLNCNRSIHAKAILASRLAIDWPTLLLRLKTLGTSGQHEWAEGAFEHLETYLAAMALGANDGRVRLRLPGAALALSCHEANLRAVGFERGENDCTVLCSADAAITSLDLSSPDQEPRWWSEADTNGKLLYRLPLQDLVRDANAESCTTEVFGTRPIFTLRASQHRTAREAARTPECRVKLDWVTPRLLEHLNGGRSALASLCKLASLTAVDFLIGQDGHIQMLCRSRLYLKELAGSLVNVPASERQVDDGARYYVVPLADLALR